MTPSTSKCTIESYTGFQPLKEVWVGDCYPEHFDQHIDDQNKDTFYKIIELTKHDLNRLHNKLVELGVIVKRPNFDTPCKFLDEFDNLIKPPITPRDWAMTLGKTLHIIPQYLDFHTGFENAIADYRAHAQEVIIADRSIPEPVCWITFPSVVRVGQDIFVDVVEWEQRKNLVLPILEQWSKEYRVHVSKTGDHSDAVFCPVNPGNIFSTHYRQKYEKSFPDWEVFFLTDTTKQRKHNGFNGRWWVPGMNFPHFNQSGFDQFDSWIGDASETVFEVNMLVVDQHNVICIAEDDAACKKLQSIGITPHVIDFKTRGFWDGGIHCLTLDIHRVGGKLNYWPDRGSCGLYYFE